ncbi:MAG TPA: hypothetical protein VI585_17280 [Candidatus Binatia bacterium]
MTRPERFPDFFLIGAPRCGTTSLSGYLADNPQVCFSRPKEPHYFSLFAPHASLDDLETAYLARYTVDESGTAYEINLSYLRQSRSGRQLSRDPNNYASKDDR